MIPQFRPGSFFDAGKPGAGIAELRPLLAATGSALDLLDPQESIDLAARLGDTDAASPFVQWVLATMATAESGKPYRSAAPTRPPPCC